MRLSVIDDEVERRCDALKAQRQREREKPAAVNIELLEASARDIVKCDDVLGMFAVAFSRIIAGEEALAKLLYLGGTSLDFHGAEWT